MAERSGSVTAEAPAKLNLYLHVLGRRPDSLHEIDSLVAFASLADRLVLGPGRGLSLRVTGPFADPLRDAEDNLVLAAARLLAEAAGRTPNAAIALEKNIPVAAGLGGGSSDAAAALRGLAALWEIPPDAVDLAALARRLGADVPVCLAGRTCFVSGAGETLTPAPRLPDAAVLLVNPGVALPTATVFGAFARTAATCGEGSRAHAASWAHAVLDRPKRFSRMPADAAGLARLLARYGNDLEIPAAALRPAIRETLAVLAALPGCRLARMSGSGATCWGLFDDVAAASRVARKIGREIRPVTGRKAWWTAVARLL